MGILTSVSGLLSLYFEYTGGFGTISGKETSTARVVGYWIQLLGGLAVPVLFGWALLSAHRALVRGIAVFVIVFILALVLVLGLSFKR